MKRLLVKVAQTRSSWLWGAQESSHFKFAFYNFRMQNFTNETHHCRVPGHDHEEAKQTPVKDCNICYYKHQKLECNPCRYLENPSTLKEVDYFTFFCLEKRYDLDKPTLVSQFKLFQKFIHPDRFSQA